MTSPGHQYRGWGGKSCFRASLGNPASVAQAVSRQFHQGWLDISSQAQEEQEQSRGLGWRWAQKGIGMEWAQKERPWELGEACFGRLHGEMSHFWVKRRPWLFSNKWYISNQMTTKGVFELLCYSMKSLLTSMVQSSCLLCIRNKFGFFNSPCADTTFLQLRNEEGWEKALIPILSCWMKIPSANLQRVVAALPWGQRL